ncbi:pyrroline-5-carboxylate reductase, partial [Dysosmobacter welbionis]
HPVGDDQHRLAGQQAGEGSLHLGLVLHIQAGGGLVQQDDGGVFQKRPGDGDALPLPAGELRPVLPDGGVIALGQAADELPAVGGLRRGPHLFVGGAPLAQADVFHHGIVKEHHILEHHGVVGQQRLRVHGGDVHAAYPDGALRNIPQPGGQPGAGALAGAGGSHQSGHFTLPGGKVHTVQYLLLVVGEAHMVEHNVVALGLETLHSLGGGGVIDFVHAVGRHLGHEQLCNEGQTLVEGGVHTGDDQQEQKQQHEVDLSGDDQAGPR